MPAGGFTTSIDALAAVPASERLVALGTSADGLTLAEASLRLRRFGPNQLPPPRARRPLFAFLANFTHTLALLLWFAAGLAFAAGLPQLGGAIVAVVAVNGLFAFVQEFRAERVVASLMRRVAVQARVLRDGAERIVPAADLVPGDVVRLAAGDIVPADCVLLSSDNVTLDLSMLTGESMPVNRSASPIAETIPSNHRQLADIACMAPSGSGVISGFAEAAVYATGRESSMGAIAVMVETIERGASLLERQVSELSRLTAVLAVGAGAATLILAGVSTDVEFVAALTFSVGVLVALVPEGLLPTLSVALAIGAQRMAERGAAVRRLSAVEAVGAVTVICTDKTGTLTQNTLSVRGFVAPQGAGEPSARVLYAAALCNDARPVDGTWSGDPMDAALVRWVSQRGLDPGTVRGAHPRLADVPFDARWRYMSVTCEIDGQRTEFIKGAPEDVLLLLGLQAPAPIEEALSQATLHGERVLLLAARTPTDTELLGMARFFDPPRPEVPAAIAACRRARIRVVMLTGDHPGTAKALGTIVGLGVDGAEVVTGAEIDGLTDRDLLHRLRGDAIFARIDPRQKLRITEVLRRSGEIVVVTGDGINDAPALRAADVGVAMGRRGTEVAKQASDVVLADDNFATIVAAIEEGRSIKENIRRFVSYVFTSNVAELAPFLLYIFLPVPLPLAVVQVLALDLGTDLVPAMALGAEPPSPHSMDAAPEPPARPLMTRALGLKTFVFFGLIEAALGIAGYLAYHWHAGWRPFDSFGPYDGIEHEARALTFLGIVAGQIGCVLAQRDGPLLRRLSLRSNKLIAYGLAFELVLALGLVYVPGLNRVFSMAPVHVVWLTILPLGAAAFLLIDLARRLVADREGRLRDVPIGSARALRKR